MKIVISPISGFDVQIGHLVSIMQLARSVTLKITYGLSIKHLDFELDYLANSIGSLLMHIGSLEFFTQHLLFKDIPKDRDEMSVWRQAFSDQLSKKTIKSHNIEYYVSQLEKVRKVTLNQLAKFTDNWLYIETPAGDDIVMNNYFRLYHLVEDEISHCGQIKLIKKRIQF